MSILNVDGTSKNAFSIGIGANRVDFRTNSGNVQFRRYNDDWVTIPKVYHSTSTPTVNDDGANTSTNGVFEVNDVWVYNNSTIYICSDNSTGAAVWDNCGVADGSITLAKLATTAKQVQVNFVFPSTFMTDRSVGDDLIENVIKEVFVWDLEDATLTQLKAIVLVDDSGATQPQINIEINGTEALSSDLTLAETESTGTIDTGNDTVTTGQRIEITVAGTGTNSDAESLTVRTLWEVTG